MLRASKCGPILCHLAAKLLAANCDLLGSVDCCAAAQVPALCSILPGGTILVTCHQTLPAECVAWFLLRLPACLYQQFESGAAPEQFLMTQLPCRSTGLSGQPSSSSAGCACRLRQLTWRMSRLASSAPL